MKCKYPINKELLPYCFKIHHFPKFFVPFLQSSLKFYGKILLNDKRVNVKTFKLENKVKMFMISPKNSNTRKVLYYIHGGGFVFPHAPYHIKLAIEYATRLDAKVFLIDYRLAPKYKYPIANEDCLLGYEFLYNNKDIINIDIDKLIIGGDSAGGYLTITTTLKIYEKYKVVPKGNMLLYPVCDTDKNSESMIKYTDTPLCNSKDAKMYDAWFNDGNMTSVLNEDLSIIPNTYMEIAEFDCLRDGAIKYKNVLTNLNKNIEFHDVLETMHGFDFAVNAKITRECVNNRIKFMESIFNG